MMRVSVPSLHNIYMMLINYQSCIIVALFLNLHTIDIDITNIGHRSAEGYAVLRP